MGRGLIVLCEDGMQRHKQPFCERYEAERFADWGHACTYTHVIQEAPQRWLRTSNAMPAGSSFYDEQGTLHTVLSWWNTGAPAHDPDGPWVYFMATMWWGHFGQGDDADRESVAFYAVWEQDRYERSVYMLHDYRPHTVGELVADAHRKGQQ